MYSTCLFCTSSLGANEVIEGFHVGRRLAFDAARGRLWVVCRKCGRWNLSPLEERWEAIEECERLFRDTRLRVSTDQIGLARLREGLELVRIGAPQRPEFAAWRYGDQFGRRKRRNVALIGAGAAVGALAMLGQFHVLTLVVPGGGAIMQLPTWVQMLRNRRVIAARAHTADGEVVVRLGQARLAQLVRHDDGAQGWALRVPHGDRHPLVTGDEARRVAGLLLARLNHAGAFQRTVRAAVDRIEAQGGPVAFITSLVREDQGALVSRWAVRGGTGERVPPASLANLSGEDRLALEMATHEETERRALEGELAALEAEWREAEEIARIADDMFLPPDVDQRLRRLRGEG